MKQQGFTLLEVMIALGVLVATATLISQSTSARIGNFASTQDRTLAYVVAENKINELLLSAQIPKVSGNDETVEMADREWTVITKSDETQFPGTFRIQVTVLLKENPGTNLATLATIMGAH